MTFHPWTFLFEIFNFLVLAYVLYRLLYHPLRTAIEQRREAQMRAQQEADKARQEATALQQQLQNQLAAMDAERQTLLHQAHEQAEGERQRLLTEADKAVQRHQDEARQALAREHDEALRALRAEVVGQAIELTRRLLREASDRSLDRQLALRLADDLKHLPAKDRETLRNHWQPDDGAVLETAGELDATTLNQVTEVLQTVLGRPVSVAVQTRPDLLAGGRLHAAGYVWDASLAGQVDGVAQANGRGPYHG